MINQLFKTLTCQLVQIRDPCLIVLQIFSLQKWLILEMYDYRHIYVITDLQHHRQR